MSAARSGTARLSLIERLTYSPAMVRVARQLPGRRILSKLYYRWRRPQDDILRVQIANVDCFFELRAHWQLRWLEGLAVAPTLDPDLRALLTTARAGDVIYDIGANMGVFTVPLAKRVGSSGMVVSFEPQTSAFDHLQTNVRLNALGNVRLYRKGLGERDETAGVEPGRENVLSRLVASDRPSGAHGGAETVSIVNGDRFRVSEGLPVPSAVKIDVEGYEDAVIAGLKDTLADPRCRLVCCEIHPPLLPPGVSEQSVLARLRALGFHRTVVHPFDHWSVAVCEKP